MSNFKTKAENLELINFQVGEPVTGLYNGSRIVETKNGESRLHKILIEGTFYEFWGCYMLDTNLEGEEGSEVRLTLKGEIDREGKQPLKNFKIEIAE